MGVKKSTTLTSISDDIDQRKNDQGKSHSVPGIDLDSEGNVNTLTTEI